MVLVDFTVAERWRIFGELSFAAVRRKEVPVTPSALRSRLSRLRKARADMLIRKKARRVNTHRRR